MNCLIKDHRLPILLLLISLTCLIGLTAQSPTTSARAGGGPPLRLRMRVEKNTLQPGEMTKVFVEFLDSDYNQVPNDRTRLIVLEAAAGGSKAFGSGEISPQQISVGPGSWSGASSFAARQAGRLLLKASSEELDSARALVLITKQQASLIESLEPVAFAQSDDDLILQRTDPLGNTETGSLPVPANNKTPAQLSITFPPNETERRTLKITTDANVRLLYRKVNEAGSTNMIEKMGSMSIPVDKGVEIVEGLNVFSTKDGTVSVSAQLSPDNLTAQTTVQFEKPKPTNIMFYEAPPTISPDKSIVSVRIGVGDQAKVKIAPIGNYQIVLSSPNDSGVVRFPGGLQSLTLSPSHQSGDLDFQLVAFPPRGKIELHAKDPDGHVSSETKVFPIESEIKKILVKGPDKLPRGAKEAEFTVHLADKDNNPQVADWDRQINLSVDDGELATKQVTILRGQAQAHVKWRLTGSADKVILGADSFPLESRKHQVILFTPAYRLVLMALLGGVIGGLARQLHKTRKLERILPIWTGKDWDLGLVGRISGSVISGLFLYWTMKFGLARVTLDLGTTPVATFFGGIGGFAGLVVLDRLVEWCFKLLRWSLPGRKHGFANAHPAPSGAATSALLKTP